MLVGTGLNLNSKFRPCGRLLRMKRGSSAIYLADPLIIQHGIKGRKDHRRWTESEMEIVREELVSGQSRRSRKRLIEHPKRFATCSGEISSACVRSAAIFSRWKAWQAFSMFRKRGLSAPLEALSGRSPQELLTEGRLRELVVEFDRLREAQPF